MTTASRGPVTAGAGLAQQTTEVAWYDAREISLDRSDLAELDAREAARAAAFVFPADRHRYQVAHVMLRRVLAGHAGTDPSRLIFGRQRCPVCGGPAGKPVVTGTTDPDADPAAAVWDSGSKLSFSLAHSGDVVAIAVARGPVGVDVERAPSGCVCALASAMHPSDAAIVEALPEPDRHTAVIRWWVRAEAVLKCAGSGIAHGMDAFPVLNAPRQGQVRTGPQLPWEPEVHGWAAAAGCGFAGLSAPKGYHAAVARPGLRLIRYRWGPGPR